MIAEIDTSQDPAESPPNINENTVRKLSLRTVVNNQLGRRYGQLEQQPHKKNGKHAVSQSSSTKTSLVLHAQFVITATSSQTQEVHAEGHQVHAQGSRTVKQRDKVPAEVSTYSLYRPGAIAISSLPICSQLPCQMAAETGAS